MGEDRELLAKNMEVLKAWERYEKEILSISTVNSFAIGEDGLRRILAVSLGLYQIPY